MNWQIQNQIKSLNLGDLVRVDWFDASVGKSSFSKGSIDIPSRSWGIYLGVLGEKNRHIILAQNSLGRRTLGDSESVGVVQMLLYQNLGFQQH